MNFTIGEIPTNKLMRVFNLKKTLEEIEIRTIIIALKFKI